MKILKSIPVILLCLTFMNCSQEKVNREESIESQSLNELTIKSRENDTNVPVYIEWIRGEWIQTYIDGILVDERCETGIGVCIDNIHEAIFSNIIGEGVSVKASYDGGFLEIEFLEEFITHDEVAQIWGNYELEMSVDEIYEMYKSRVNIQQAAYIGTEITESLIAGSSGWELKMIPGEYGISYANSPFGTVRIEALPITDPEKEDKEKTNKKAKN